MKAFATLALASVLFLAAVLPASSPVIKFTSDTLIAGRVGIGNIPRPRTEEQPVFDIDLGTLIAGKVGTGGVPRPRTEEQPVFDIDLGTLIAGKLGIGGVPRG